jgi:alpha-L-rhamnosidase
VDRAGNRGEVVSLTRSVTPPALSVTGGSRLLIEASGFGAAVSVRVELHSDPVLLATVTADAAGVIATIADVPADFPSGEHRLVLAPMADGSGTPGNPGNGGTVTVPVGVIASTGFDPMLPLAFAVLLVAVGAWFVVRRRRELVGVGHGPGGFGGGSGGGSGGGAGSAG